MSKDFGYLFETPAYITMLEKQQRILDDMMRPYKELSGIYAGLGELIKNVQVHSEMIRMTEEINTVARKMNEAFRVPVEEIQKSIRSAFDISSTYNYVWKSAFAPYHNMMNTHHEVFQTLQKAFEVYNKDSILEIYRVAESLAKKHELYSDACTTLASVLTTTFPEENVSLDDVDFSFGLDGSISIDGRTYKEEEIPLVVEEQVQDIKKWTASDIPESFDVFKKKHVLLFFILAALYVFFTYPVDVQDGISFYKNIVQALVTQINGWDEWYYINNENGAAVYQEPSTESPVIMRATYSNAVRKTADSKFWVKVQYPNLESETGCVEGWIAKRNLIPYADVEFDGDEAVCD